MSRKRTDFKIMGQKDFMAYLKERDVSYTKFETTTVLGLSVVKITPDHYRLRARVFQKDGGEQLDPKIQLTGIDMESRTNRRISRQQFIRIIDERIQNMGTKGVYHPKRLKPKWNSLTDDSEKLELFEKYITNKESSIGFLKLIKVNLCHKTLEAIVIEYPTSVEYLTSNDIKSICVDKFSKYDNGKRYLRENNIEPSG